MFVSCFVFPSTRAVKGWLQKGKHYVLSYIIAEIWGLTSHKLYHSENPGKNKHHVWNHVQKEHNQFHVIDVLFPLVGWLIQGSPPINNQ